MERIFVCGAKSNEYLYQGYWLHVWNNVSIYKEKTWSYAPMYVLVGAVLFSVHCKTIDQYHWPNNMYYRVSLSFVMIINILHVVFVSVHGRCEMERCCWGCLFGLCLQWRILLLRQSYRRTRETQWKQVECCCTSSQWDWSW